MGLHPGFSSVFTLWRVVSYSREHGSSEEDLGESRVTRSSAGGYYGMEVSEVVVEWQQRWALKWVGTLEQKGRLIDWLFHLQLCSYSQVSFSSPPPGFWVSTSPFLLTELMSTGCV